MKMKVKLFLCLLIFLLALPLMALPPKGKRVEPTAQQIDNIQYINANRIMMFVTNHGNFARDLGGVFGYDYGTWFPYTSVEAIAGDINQAGEQSPNYASGLWIGAVDSVTQEKRICLSEYSSEYVPGPMANGTFQPDQGAYKVYHLYRDSLAGNPNSDYLNWPFDQGAPYEKDSLGDPILDNLGNMIPEMIGDQMMWSVFNDADPDQHSNDAGDTNPLGIEIKQTIFAFDREGSLGNIVFLRMRVYNKGGNILEDCYFSLWDDPDLGGAGDDLVGCDTTLALGYVYNSTNDDSQYGAAPPSMGYDFFQGPLVETGNPQDTARMWGELYPGYMNMGMTSFNKYINGTDPDNFGQSYGFMQGLQKDGSAYVYNGDTLTFVHTGDPVAGTGDLDENPADRRFMQTTGPIKFRPGDSLEILAAIVVGRGGSNLQSITVMKNLDDFAQKTYENGFNPPTPPARPVVSLSYLPNEVTFSWGDTSEVDPGAYEFEGYTVWQGESASGPWTILATYDVPNARTDGLVDTLFDPASGLNLPVVKRAITNSGLKRYFHVTRDWINGGPLNDLTTYYFRVTAFSFADSLNGEPVPNGDRFLETSTPVTVVPQAPPAGTHFSEGSFDTLEVVHTATGGPMSNGNVLPLVTDPYSLTGDSYQVDFANDTTIDITYDTTQYFTIDTLTDTCDAYWDTLQQELVIIYCEDTTLDSTTIDGPFVDTAVATYWTWINTTTGDTLAARQFNQSGDENYPIEEGILLKVIGPEFGVVAIDEVDGAGGTPIDPPDNVMYSLNSTGDWYIASDQGSDFSRMNWLGLIGTSDWEFRFTQEGAEYYNYSTDLLWPDRSPFEVWNIGIGTPDDPSDDHEIFYEIIDDDGSGGWSYGDRIYPFEVDYFEPAPADASTIYTWPASFHIGRIVIEDYSGATTQPAEGTVIRFTTAKVNTFADVFTFSTEPPSYTSTESDLDKIKAVPNPFYLYSSYDASPGSKLIKWHHLPETCTITVYNLAGDLMRTIRKDDATATAGWDLLTENGLPVASGIYIFVVDAPGFGQKIGKMAIFTEREVLQIY